MYLNNLAKSSVPSSEEEKLSTKKSHNFIWNSDFLDAHSTYYIGTNGETEQFKTLIRDFQD